MSEENFGEFERSHDPDDLAARNIEIGGLLRRVGATYQSVDVVLDSSCTDTELAISSVAYDPTEQVVSFLITGGNRTAQALDSDGVTLREGYLIRCRVFFADGRHQDQSYFQKIRPH